MWQTDEEFDDGGTPAWRARHTVINAERVGSATHARPGIKAWFKRTPFWKLAVCTVFLGFILPWAIIIVPMVVGTVWTAVTQGSGR